MELQKTIENLRKTWFGYFNLNKEVLSFEICKTGLFIWDGNNIKTYSILTKNDIGKIEIFYNIKKWHWYYINKGGQNLFNCPYYRNYQNWNGKRIKKGFYLYSEGNRIGLDHQDKNLYYPFFIDTEFDDNRTDYSEYWKTL